MKKLNYLYLLGLLLFAAVNFSACSDSDEPEQGSSSELVGLWEGVSIEGWFKYDGETVEFEDNHNDARLQFNSDGTCESYEYYDGSWDLDSEGRWEYNKGKLSITYYDDYEGTTTDVVTVKELTASRLVVESYDIDEEWEESYAVLTFKRIK